METLLAPYMLAFMWASILLPLSVFIRAKVKLFQKLIFPSSLIAGFIGMFAMNLGLIGYPSPEGWVRIDVSIFQDFTNLFYALGFTLIGLTAFKAKSNTNNSGKRSLLRGGLWMCIVFSIIYMVQMILGVGVVSAWNGITGSSLEVASGFMTGIGFSGGPGPAIAYGTMWEKAGMENMVAVGVAYATIGYIMAAFLGVAAANWGIKKGLAQNAGVAIDESFRIGLWDKNRPESMGRQITQSANLDSLTFHIGILMFAFSISWLFCYVLKYFLLPPALGSISFDMIYMWGLLFGMLLSFVINQLGQSERIDDGTANRLTGMFIDYVIVSCLMSINISAISSYAGPILITAILATAFTFWAVYWFAKKLESSKLERFLAVFGMSTGTGSNGLLLVRIVDPEYKTSAAVEIGVSGSLMILFLMPLYFLYSVLPEFGISNFLLVISGYVVFFLVLIFVLRNYLFKDPRGAADVEDQPVLAG